MATLRSSREGYGVVAKVFHWTMAVLIVFSWGLGTWMVDIESLGEKFSWYQVHKSWGVVIFGLAVLRLAWRYAAPRPVLPREMKPHEKLMAHLAHIGLYGLMIAIPVTGWLMSSASPFPAETRVFDLFALPHPIAPDEAVKEFWLMVHVRLTDALALLLLLHVAAALKHHYVNRDDVLRRMLPRRGPAPEEGQTRP